MPEEDLDCMDLDTSEVEGDDSSLQKMEIDDTKKRRRNQFLLEQTDLFNHFLSFKEARQSGKEVQTSSVLAHQGETGKVSRKDKQK